jgi:glycosyltransferase involved in cell wall biosynthesis
MNSDATITVRGSSSRAATERVAPRAARLGLICDLLEERWPSMDLVGDMLFQNLTADPASGIEVEQLRPQFRRRFSKIPGLGLSGVLWNADRLLNRFHDYPATLKRRTSDFDLFHIVDHSYSQLTLDLPPNRTVVTCHDLDTFRCILEPERDPRPRWFRAVAARILEGFRCAAQVLTVSEATRNELIRHGIFPAERINVVLNGVHPSCCTVPDPAADASANALLDAPSSTVWLLSVGSTIPRKRLDVLLRVFAAIHRQLRDVRLVRVGGLTPQQHQLADELNVQHSILCLPHLDRNILAAVYRRSALLLHTADAEGFGLPLVEALACGCPVAASDLPVLREVGGLAVSYCQVADLDDWQRVVMELLTERVKEPDNWAIRREAGLARAAGFSWAENARQTAQVYRKVLELPRGEQNSERKDEDVK